MLARKPRPARRGRGLFERWAEAIMRRPLLALAGASAVLVALASPALGLEVGDGALRQFPPGNETRAGFEAASTVTGPGRGSPVKVLVAPSRLDRTVAILRADPEVVRTSVRARTADHRYILVVATPRHDGDSAPARALVRRLRDELPPGSLVGGNSAAELDFDAAITGSMWKVAAFVLAFAFLMLMAMLRSVVLPLLAVVANVLSVGTAYGVLTVVFVRGWLDAPLGLDSPGYVDTVALPLVLAIVFGLSMDYQVFLLSRIRERRLGGAATREAVRDGLASSGRTITSAALVMVAVFAVFVATGVPAVREVALGCAVAIAVDATVVRLVLVPGAMALLGERCWWRPRRPGQAPVEGEAAWGGARP